MQRKELLIVTGATGGLGKEISLYFAALATADSSLHPVMCCRNVQKAEELKQIIEQAGLSSEAYSIFLADLSSSASVDSLAASILSLQLPIRALINNAGSMFGSYQTNADGIEMNMAVNFYTPARLSEMLAKQMVSHGSIVNIVSLSRKYVDIDSHFLTAQLKSYTRIVNYSKSKLALSIFTADMGERYPGLYINGVDPGIVNTKMLKMDKWFDKLADYVFRPFTLQPSQSVEAVQRAFRNSDGVNGYVFSRKKQLPFELRIAHHPLKQLIRTTVCGAEI